jgi:hypothetical protein
MEDLIWKPPFDLPHSTPGVKKHQYNVAKEVFRRVSNPDGSLKMGPRIGSQSAFGIINIVGDQNRFVMKTMYLRTPSEHRIFVNELTVGMNPAIRIVGPKIYLWRQWYKDGLLIGQYIMDNFTKGRPGYFTMSLQDYAQKTWDTCPGPNDKVVKLLKKRLTQFWKITKGYHGDLHTENIALLFNEAGDLKNLFIFDYGAHKKFKNLRESNYQRYCFEDYIKVIQKQFKISRNRKGGSNFYPNVSVPIVKPKGQPYRSNVNMLSKLNYKNGRRTLGPKNKSLLNILLEKPKESFMKRFFSHK